MTDNLTPAAPARFYGFARTRTFPEYVATMNPPGGDTASSDATIVDIRSRRRSASAATQNLHPQPEASQEIGGSAPNSIVLPPKTPTTLVQPTPFHRAGHNRNRGSTSEVSAAEEIAPQKEEENFPAATQAPLSPRTRIRRTAASAATNFRATSTTPSSIGIPSTTSQMSTASTAAPSIVTPTRPASSPNATVTFAAPSVTSSAKPPA